MRIFLPKFLILVTLLCVVGLSAFTKALYAQDLDLGFATYVPIKDVDVEDGSIVTSSRDGLYLARYPYDDAMTGVVNSKPAIVLGFKKTGQYPVNTKGSISVRVSTMNGKIVSGDLLTSSTMSGVAMKATKSGMVLGSAISEYPEEDGTKIGRIPLFIDIRYAEIGSKDEQYAVKKSIAPWRIGLGAAIAILSTVMCFYLYGKYTAKVVEAMARNPLASKNLKRNMFIQGFFLLLFIGTGYFITYILLRG